MYNRGYYYRRGIITENQIQHIKDRHPEAYNKSIEKYTGDNKYPDYIIRDKHAYNGTRLLKEYKRKKDFYRLY
mgnify:CR=1 FL=1